MGAPAVIAVPSKSYVAINSYKSSRSLPSTLCDLGRVSNIAAAVTLPRTPNFGNRNSVAQSIRSLPHKKRPISEVMDYSNSRPENASTEISTTNAVESHKKRRYTIRSQSSISAIATPSVGETNLDRNHDSYPQTKIMKLNSTETCSKPAKDKKSYSISHHQTTQRNQNTQLSIAQSTISPPRPLFLQQDQLRSHEAETHAHLQSNQHVRSHGPSIPQLPNQLNSQQVSRHHLLSMQLQQQNQQLRNENMHLQKQLSLFRQLIKNPQRLNQVLTRVEQRAH